LAIYEVKAVCRLSRTGADVVVADAVPVFASTGGAAFTTGSASIPIPVSAIAVAIPVPISIGGTVLTGTVLTGTVLTGAVLIAGGRQVVAGRVAVVAGAAGIGFEMYDYFIAVVQIELA